MSSANTPTNALSSPTRFVGLLACIGAALAISACGGGGGSGNTGGDSPGAGTSPPSSGNLATSVPSPSYPAGSVELAMFNQLNDVRLKGGFGMLAQHAALDQAAKNHANYLLLNAFVSGQWDDSQIISVDAATGTLTGHVEKVGSPGYTGVLPIHRAASKGYQGDYVGEAVAPLYTASISQPYAGCIDQLLSTVFHRNGLINPRLRNFGATVQTSQDGKGLVCVVNPAYVSRDIGTVPAGWVGIYPYPAQTGLATSMIYGEAPDPVPSAPIKGQPVSIYVEPQNILTVSSFTLVDNVGNQIPAKTLTNKEFPGINAATAFIVPTQALNSGVTYTAQFVGANNGTPLSRTWNFTTR